MHKTFIMTRGNEKQKRIRKSNTNPIESVGLPILSKGTKFGKKKYYEEHMRRSFVKMPSIIVSIVIYTNALQIIRRENFQFPP